MAAPSGLKDCYLNGRQTKLGGRTEDYPYWSEPAAHCAQADLDTSAHMKAEGNFRVVR